MILIRRANGLVLPLLVVALGGGCEDKSSGTDDGGGGGGDARGADAALADMEPPPSGLVSFKAANDEIELDFEGGTESYLIVPYSLSTVAADAISFSIKLSGGGTTSQSSSSLRLPRVPLSVRNPQLWSRLQARLSIERWTRKRAEWAARLPMSLPAGKGLNQPLAACSTSSECQSSEVCHLGDCASSVSVKVQAFANTVQSVDAQVKRKGTHVAILVDSRDTVDDVALDALLNEFETVIHPRSVALFGNPPVSPGKLQLSSDRNADGLVWLVITQAVLEKQPPSVGFFVGDDFTDKPHSNKTDLLYLKPPDTQSPIASYYNLTAHEYQHLLAFGSKVYRRTVAGASATLDELWIYEGLAHLAEDVCGYGAENVTLLDEQLFTDFADHRLLETDLNNDGLGMRAKAMTYLRYLFERKGAVTYPSGSPEPMDGGGAAWLQAFVAGEGLGTDGVDQTFGDHKQAVGDWLAALALAGRGITDFAAYNFDPFVTDPVTGNEIGLTIRGKRNDATGAEVELLGPAETAISGDSVDDEFPNSSAKFFVLSGRTGKVKLQVTTPESDFRYLVVKLK